MDSDEGAEERLTGGNASTSVVRIGKTVRKPWLATTERTVAYMHALRQRGIDVPEPHGRDDQGRLILDLVPGNLATDHAPLDIELIKAAGAVVRSIHDASVGLPVPAGWEVILPAKEPDLLCHNDLATWNLIIDGDRLVFIDWDGAGPSTRVWDLAYAAISFGHLFPDENAPQRRGSSYRLRRRIRRRSRPEVCTTGDHGAACRSHARTAEAISREWPRAVGIDVRGRPRPALARNGGVHQRASS